MEFVNYHCHRQYSNAVTIDCAIGHEDYIKRIKELGLTFKPYNEVVGEITAKFDTISVCGTHGKTTTTSMLSYILLAGNTDPTISAGGILDTINGNIRVGHSETFVTEACEYTNSFLEFFPKISIILNIEEDHMDFFKDLDDIRILSVNLLTNFLTMVT